MPHTDITENPVELTYWQKAVWITFNPSWDEKVQRVKNLYAEIIDICNDMRNEGCWPNDWEQKRLLSVAITEAQTAQMWAVKWLTFKN